MLTSFVKKEFNGPQYKKQIYIYIYIYISLTESLTPPKKKKTPIHYNNWANCNSPICGFGEI